MVEGALFLDMDVLLPRLRLLTRYEVYLRVMLRDIVSFYCIYILNYMIVIPFRLESFLFESLLVSPVLSVWILIKK